VGSPRDWFRLTRLPLVATASGDAVACALLARGPGIAQGGDASFPSAARAIEDLLLLAATSALLYVAGMVGNDLADRRLDATIHPDRPLPRGRISPVTAALVALLAGAGAVALGGGRSGSREAVVASLGFAWLYDAFAKRWTVPGAVAMGLVRASNAAVGVVPLVRAGASPPWALAAPLLLGLYSAGVTTLSTAEGRPQRLPWRLFVARVLAFVAFAGCGVLSLLAANGMTVGAFVASGACLSILFARVPRPRPVPMQVLEMLLGFHWLEAILATGGFAGSAWPAQLGAVLVGYGLILVAMFSVHLLRASPA
jgi:hypothetical protein